MHNVEEVISSEENIINLINLFPQTYKTILTKQYIKDGTKNNIIRRRLNILTEDGLVCKSVIPGTRRGEIIYYTKDKKYIIYIDSDRININIYCYFDFEQVNNYYIKLNKYFILVDCEWVEKNEEKFLFTGNCLKII